MIRIAMIGKSGTRYHLLGAQGLQTLTYCGKAAYQSEVREVEQVGSLVYHEKRDLCWHCQRNRRLADRQASA